MGYIETLIEYHKKLGTIPNSSSLKYISQINKKLENKTKQDIFTIFINSKILKEKQKNEKELKKIEKEILKSIYKRENFVKKNQKVKETRLLNQIKEKDRIIKDQKKNKKELERKLKHRANKNINKTLKQYKDSKELERKFLKFFNNIELMRFDRIYSIISPLFQNYKINETFDSIKPLQNIVTTIMSRYEEKTLERSVYQGISEVLEKNPQEFLSECKNIGEEIKQIEKNIKIQGKYKEFKETVCVNEL
jgi:hypothetical protein